MMPGPLYASCKYVGGIGGLRDMKKIHLQLSEGMRAAHGRTASNAAAARNTVAS